MRDTVRPTAARLITEGWRSVAESRILLAVRRGLTGVAFVFCLASAHAGIGPDERASTALEKYVQQALRDWEVPGAAIAVVKDDRIVY